jgi:sugar phosphate isomerase/epimerase
LNGYPEVGIDHLTMLDVSPPDLVSVAREAGFDLVGLRVVPATPGEEPWPMTAGGPMIEETARRLDDTGVGVLSVEVVRIGPGTKREDYERVLEAGSRLRARYVTVNVDDPDIERACEAFATLTDDARPYDLRPLVEPIPYTEVSNLEEAVHIAGHSDGGGILLDTLHFQRYGGQLEQLRSVDRELLAYVQLCDGPLNSPSAVPHPHSLPRGQSTDGTDLQLESRAMRLLPGDGELPLRAFLAALPAGIAISVEAPVLSLQKSLSPVEFALLARAAVANVLPENGGNPGR